MNPHVFEVIMLVCFGAAWPFSIYKMLKTRKSQGKSIYFLAIILGGYIAGILFKYFGVRNNIIFLYILNMFMVAWDLGLTIKYRRNWL
jgi:hypothetical protein